MPRKKIENKIPQPSSVKDMKTRLPIKELPAICRNIRRFRKKSGLEQKELAKQIGVTSNAVSNWENGRSRPDFNLLPSLCAALEITLYDLLGTEGPSLQYSVEEQLLIDKYRNLNSGHRYAVNRLVEALTAAEITEQKAPLVRELIYYGRPLSAGLGDPTEIEDYGVPIHLYSSRTVDRSDYVFTVNGDSMEPAYHDGDMVLVARIPDAPALQYGEIGAFIAGNETYIKKYEEDGLHSLNPAYAPLKFSNDTNVFLIGRVMGILEQEQIAKRVETFID